MTFVTRPCPEDAGRVMLHPEPRCVPNATERRRETMKSIQIFCRRRSQSGLTVQDWTRRKQPSSYHRGSEEEGARKIGLRQAAFPRLAKLLDRQNLRRRSCMVTSARRYCQKWKIPTSLAGFLVVSPLCRSLPSKNGGPFTPPDEPAHPSMRCPLRPCCREWERVAWRSTPFLHFSNPLLFTDRCH